MPHLSRNFPRRRSGKTALRPLFLIASGVMAAAQIAPGALSIVSAEPRVLRAQEADIVRRTNRFRQKNGLKPVRVDTTLTRVAQSFACYMATTGRYGHEADGRTPTQRAQARRWPTEGCVSENIAWNKGYATGEQGPVLTQGWIDSPGHRANMLTKGAQLTGVGICIGGDGKHYGVQLLGRKSWASLKIINHSRRRLQVRYAYGHDKVRTDTLAGVQGGYRFMTVKTCGYYPVTVSDGAKRKTAETADREAEITFR